MTLISVSFIFSILLDFVPQLSALPIDSFFSFFQFLWKEQHQKLNPHPINRVVLQRKTGLCLHVKTCLYFSPISLISRVSYPSFGPDCFSSSVHVVSSDDDNFETCKLSSFLLCTFACVHTLALSWNLIYFFFKSFHQLIRGELFCNLSHFLYALILYIKVLQRVKTPIAKPKKISESGSEDR